MESRWLTCTVALCLALFGSSACAGTEGESDELARRACQNVEIGLSEVPSSARGAEAHGLRAKVFNEGSDIAAGAARRDSKWDSLATALFRLVTAEQELSDAWDSYNDGIGKGPEGSLYTERGEMLATYLLECKKALAE